MAQKVEQWLSKDGSAHPTEEAANGNDNDLALLGSLNGFIDHLYKVVPERDNLYKRMERQQLAMALFTSRKPLLDSMLRHNAGPTLRPVETPQAAQASPPAPAPEAPKAPLGIPPKPNASPAASGDATSSGDKPAIPDNFIFNTGKP